MSAPPRIGRSLPATSEHSTSPSGVVNSPTQMSPVVSRWSLSTRPSLAPRRLNMLLLGIFAAVALALAVVGTYAVMAYVVSERVHEMGIRLALGARPADVLWLVARGGLQVGAIGVALGLAGALAAGQGLRRLLFGVTPADPLTLAGVALVIAVAVLIASYLPARRAA